MMWFLLVLVFIPRIQLVIQADKNRLILKGGSGPCEGHVEVYYEGKWGYLGDKYWDRNTEKVVCRSANCGSPVEGSTKDVRRPKHGIVGFNEVRCNGSENHLLECTYPGWEVSFYRKPTLKAIKCSSNITIRLDGFACAGAVQYYIDGKAQGYFCDTDWGQKERDFLCNSLGCNNSVENTVHEWMVWKEYENAQKMIIKCPNITKVDYLWQCEIEESPACKSPLSVTCEDYRRMQLKGNTSNVCSGRLEMLKMGKWAPVTGYGTKKTCEEMHCGTYVHHSLIDNGIQLTCTDNVSVVLMDNGKPSKCYGTVHINKNGLIRPVCAFNSQTEAKVVCKELNCGNVVSYEKGATYPGIMDNAKCLGSEFSLWHCQGKHRDSARQCSSTAYVVCEDSISVRLKDGPGKCAGRVEIHHKGRWKQVLKDGWTDRNSDSFCRQVNCGNYSKSNKLEKFSQGPRDFINVILDCQSSNSTISSCFTHKLTKQASMMEAVGITCEEHKMVFLDGDTECSGMVGIKHGNNAYWLSGSKKTWDQESANQVCHQMQCGHASSFSNIPIPNADMEKKIWDKAFKCLPNTTSLFECETLTPSSDTNDTIAIVSCSGERTVNLTNQCYGEVNICLEGSCGGLCGDSWTHNHAVMLCESLDCGNKVLSQVITQPQNGNVMFKSLHATKQNSRLTHYNFIMNSENDNTCNSNSAYVICSGSVKAKLTTFGDKCRGNVGILYDGNWLPVCKNALQDKKVKGIICKELKCGHSGEEIDYLGPGPALGHFISHLDCSQTSSDSLRECYINQSTSCTPAGLKCAESRKMQLSGTCKGAVSVYTNEGYNAVSVKNWTKAEGEMLCKDLNCGRFKSKTISRTSEKLSFWNGSFHCVNESEPQNIWDCETETSHSQKEQLFIECEEEYRINLTEKCHGMVTINDVNVCNSNWNSDYSNLLCQELNCGNAIQNITVQDKTQVDPNADYYHISCDTYDYELGQCKRVKGKCNGQLVSVHCVEDIQFNTTEKCGGQIKVKYRNYWEGMCPVDEKTGSLLCKKLHCGVNAKIGNKYKKQKVNLETAMNCSTNHKDLRYCVIQESCARVQPAEIYCEGYQARVASPVNTNNTLPVILGVGLLLVLMIVIIVFVRIRIVKRAKNVMNDPLRSLAKKEVEFESGDYEDVFNKSNEMEDFRSDRFRSQGEFFTEKDARRTSSISYDDVGEVVETQPLNSQAATVGASTHNYIPEGALDQNGVTYEVDDPQGNYDDIEASPEITQIKAEVHDGPKTTSEGDTMAPLELVQEDVDYLVPGQDGKGCQELRDERIDTTVMSAQ